MKIHITILSLGLVLLCSACKTSTSEDAQDASKSPSGNPVLSVAGEVNPQKAAHVNVELGLGYLAQGQITRAKTKLVHALKLAPELPETHGAMAYFFEKTGEYKDAEKEHKKAIKLDNGSGVVYNNYGAFLCRNARLKEADAAFRKALEDKDYARTAEVYENAGICALQWPDLDKAETYLKIAIRRDGKRSLPLLELAQINIQRGKLADAEHYLNAYRSFNKPSARSLWLSIQLARAANDKDSEASHALTLKNLFPDSKEYQLYLGSVK